MLIVKQAGRTTWSGSVQVLTASLWVAVPPLILWALWMVSRGASTREPVGVGRRT